MQRSVVIISSFLLMAVTSLGALAGVPANIAAAVKDGARPAADRQRDADRKPGETLAVAGVKSGMVVADLIPGGGYFTRLFSVAVGPKGHVYAVTPPRPADTPADTPDYSAGAKAAAADPHYTNISLLVQSVKSLSLPAPADLVFTAQNYHDVHNVPDIDIAAFNKSVFDALKPGGVYLVIDHVAEAGSGLRDTTKLHRIDPAVVKSEVTAAGFVLESQSKLLNQSADDHTLTVFDPKIRGKTDQFLFKFRKPAK
jgi:predicted methyltransferase